ncbi:MAG: aspartate--ammonia ligase [Brevinema sp.]
MYQSKLNLIDTEVAIKEGKTIFEQHLAENLNLLRVSAPLFLEANTGLNDDLNGIEHPVSFSCADQQIEIVQSLAKWKRMALYRYELQAAQGLYTDMNAVRPCESLDELHSLYVDQWDWEKVIRLEDRNLDKLKEVVYRIYDALKKTEESVNHLFPILQNKLPKEIVFVHTQELEDMFPHMTPKQREYEITKCHKAVFLIGIGGKLNSGIPHDGRAPDYDDWTLNGDILLYHEVLDCALEISSMGIRVDAFAMENQLAICKVEERKELDFHKMVLNNVLPLSIGGGIGQSRLSMFLLEKVHIGEVQVSVWPKNIIKECAYKRIFLL